MGGGGVTQRGKEITAVTKQTKTGERRGGKAIKQHKNRGGKRGGKKEKNLSRSLASLCF